MLFPRGAGLWAALGNGDGWGSGSHLQVPGGGLRGQDVGEPSQRGLCLLARLCPASWASGFFNLLLCDRLHTWWWGHSSEKDTPPTGSLLRVAQQEAE